MCYIFLLVFPLGFKQFFYSISTSILLVFIPQEFLEVQYHSLISRTDSIEGSVTNIFVQGWFQPPPWDSHPSLNRTVFSYVGVSPRMTARIRETPPQPRDVRRGYLTGDFPPRNLSLLRCINITYDQWNKALIHFAILPSFLHCSQFYSRHYLLLCLTVTGLRHSARSDRKSPRSQRREVNRWRKLSSSVGTVYMYPRGGTWLFTVVYTLDLELFQDDNMVWTWKTQTWDVSSMLSCWRRHRSSSD